MPLLLVLRKFRKGEKKKADFHFILEKAFSTLSDIPERRDERKEKMEIPRKKTRAYSFIFLTQFLTPFKRA